MCYVWLLSDDKASYCPLASTKYEEITTINYQVYNNFHNSI